MTSDFFEGRSGLQRGWRRGDRVLEQLRDAGLQAGFSLSGGPRKVRSIAEAAGSRRILIAAVEVPSRPLDIHQVLERMTRETRHQVSISVVPMADRGKFANIDYAIAKAGVALETLDWLLIVDDDVAFAPAFLDQFLALSEAADLSLSQPAHRWRSFTTYALTKQRWGSLVRTTNFVEIGPVTAIRRSTFAHLLPFPQSRWGYGIDVYWSEIARRMSWNMGIVDATPVGHLRPVAGGYSSKEAVEEGRALLQRLDVGRSRADVLAPGCVAIPW